MKKTMRFALAVALVAILVMLAGCTATPQNTEEPTGTPQGSVQPEASVSPDATEDSEPVTTLPPMPGVDAVSALDYLPQANIKKEYERDLGGGKKGSISYIYVQEPDYSAASDTTYVVTGFIEDQPMYYSRFITHGENIYSTQEDDQGVTNLFMPLNLYEGTTFVTGDNFTATIMEFNYKLDNNEDELLLIKVDTTAYPTGIYYVYKKGVGEIEQYTIDAGGQKQVLQKLITLEYMASEDALALFVK